jgi:hypothetical protein
MGNALNLTTVMFTMMGFIIFVIAASIAVIALHLSLNLSMGRGGTIHFPSFLYNWKEGLKVALYFALIGLCSFLLGIFNHTYGVIDNSWTKLMQTNVYSVEFMAMGPLLGIALAGVLKIRTVDYPKKE